MEQQEMNYEITKQVLTSNFDLLFKGKKLSMVVIDNFDGKLNISLTGNVLGEDYTLSFIHEGSFLFDDIISTSLMQFEKIYF